MRIISHLREHAFSLLELVVVMAIIMTLMAIIVPPMFHFLKYVRHLGGD